MWRGGGTGEGICYHIFGSRSVGWSECKFRNECKLALLSCRFGWCESVECMNEWFVFSVELERAALQGCAKMENGGIHCLEFTVKSGKLLLR